MPYVRGAAKAIELSWDAFPKPTPESESWQPDPDSVPIAGGLPDPRFNKDPLTERQKMALKRNKRHGFATDDLNTSTCFSSPAAFISRINTPTGVGSWPAPAPRATGLSRVFAPPAVQHPIFTTPETLKPAKEAVAAPTMAPLFDQVTTTARWFTNGSEGSTETLPVQPLFQRPHTPAASITSQQSESPTKTPAPAWARSLAHLLGEPPPKLAPLSQPLPALNQPATLPPASTPPHLRKQRLAAKTESTKATAVSKSTNVTGQETFTRQDDIGPVHYPAEGDAEPIKMVEGLNVQKTLLESFIPKKPVSSFQDHRRYLNTKLISIMEDEMDMQTRTTRQQLQGMSDSEFDSHLAKTTYMHKLSWEVKQRTRETGEMDLKASLANF
ncbi:hypothetical protein BU25DRAFT_472689 [Macroventuria anomochaeta]|uniref:Uncharacterized protein n=1 Tax=Macroventuria anomochaeta TaxID=301207 RepID=A0ACB6RV27_9PLEO|nr:uncharacterized protein BU25DRAFT_472689 [Macroventuria anomochaeta]KAF2625896.1 hypothetical protein BU25DRAFT_472689 [Macroventuria anomochaeta]